jgi:hypothetical protein
MKAQSVIINYTAAGPRENFMRKIAITLTLLMISFFQAANASEPVTKAPAKENNLVAKKVWMENIQNKLPTLLCEKDEYFMKCFSVTQNECIDFNKLFVQACLNNVALALPAELNDEHSKRWGAVIGKCSLDLFEKFLSSKKQNLAECKVVKKDDIKEEKKEKKEQKKSTKKAEPAP